MSGPGAATLDAATQERGAEPSSGYERPGVRVSRRERNTNRRRFTTAALIGLVVAGIPYLWVLWNGQLDPLRTAWPGGALSNFYDLQARALFHGHWDVPKGSLGFEAFVVGGRHYMYFGPFPSLLRMPVLAVTDSLDGKLTAASMLLAWVVTGLFSSLLLWRVRLLLRGQAPVGRAEAASVAVLIVTMTSGSVLLYLAGMPWVYHEAIAWSVAMGTGALFGLVGVLERPSAWRVAATGALTLATLLSRNTVGWGCVIAVVLAAIWFALGRGGEENRRWWLSVLAAGVVPLAAGCAISWIKFGGPFALPMGAQVFTKLDEHRRQVLAQGGLWNFSFLPSTSWAYLRPTGLRLTQVFPFITLPSAPASEVNGATLDQSYRTASLSASMPLLFLLGIWGAVTAFRRRTVGRVRLTCIPIFAMTAATSGVLLAGYIANRYLAEFLPLLILAGAVGLVDLWRRVEGRSLRVRGGALAAVAALASFGLAANLAVASTPTDVTAWEGERVRSYVGLQKSISDITGHPLARNVRHGERLPAWAPADQLFVVGSCAGLYISTGERRGPWIPVEVREIDLAVTYRGPLPDMGAVPLVSVGNDPGTSVSVEGGGAHSVRFRVDHPRGLPITSAWTRVQLHRTYRVTVAADTAFHRILVTMNGQAVLRGSTSASGQPVAQPVLPVPGGRPLPLTVETPPSPEPTLCRSLTGPKK